MSYRRGDRSTECLETPLQERQKEAEAAAAEEVTPKLGHCGIGDISPHFKLFFLHPLSGFVLL